MKRKDIIMTEELKDFLSFDLGHMDESKFENKVYDVIYSNNEDLSCDIYYPEEKKDKYPVFLIVYGGGWVSGFKRSRFIEPMLKPLQHGYACVVPDYTLAVDGMFPEPIKDLKNAIAWIKEKGSEYSLDGTNITVWGESAGGHLCLECTLMPDELFELDYKQNTKVKSVVSFYPHINIQTSDEQMKATFPDGMMSFSEDSVFGIFMGPQIHDKKALEMSNPTNYISADMPKIWLQHGDQDKLVPYQQTIEFTEAVKEKYPETILHSEICEGKEHTDSYFFTDENLKRIIDFIES